MFLKRKNADILPPHQDYSCPVDLQLGPKIPVGCIYTVRT